MTNLSTIRKKKVTFSKKIPKSVNKKTTIPFKKLTKKKI